MHDPDLISARIYQSSPDGRLERLEAVVQEMLDDDVDVDAHHFRKYVGWARDARRSDRMTDVLRYIAKADHALTLIDYMGDPDRLRGAKIVEAAQKGGEARKLGVCESVIPEMKRLLSRGGTISWAAKTAFTNGFGSSAKANRQLWYRYSKNNPNWR